MIKTRRFISVFVVASMVFGFGLLTVQPVYAQTGSTIEQCKCFCKTDGGAKPEPNKTTPSKCQEACSDTSKGKRGVATCATKPIEYPASTRSCFKKELCEGEQYKGVWDAKYQPPECLPGDHYCYPDPKLAKKTKLNVSIGELKITADIGEYVSQMYRFLLGAGLTIAIVLTMIGGLQYVMAAGSGQVSQAKTRIKNAVTGLVLMLFAYAILYTVNPNLVTLKVPQFPMIKTLILAHEDSCEKLLKEGWGMTYEGKKECGTIAEIGTAPAGKEVVEGATCMFTRCPKANHRCLGVGQNAFCGQCKDVNMDDAEKHGVKPSVSVCESLALGNEVVRGVTVGAHYCYHTRDQDVLVSAGDKALIAAAVTAAGIAAGPVGVAAALGGTATALADDVVHGICAELKIDCNKITECEDYESLDVESSENAEDLHDMGHDNWGAGSVNMKFICETDPCQIGIKKFDKCETGGEEDECDHASSWSKGTAKTQVRKQLQGVRN